MRTECLTAKSGPIDVIADTSVVHSIYRVARGPRLPSAARFSAASRRQSSPCNGAPDTTSRSLAGTCACAGAAGGEEEIAFVDELTVEALRRRPG